MDHSKPSFIRKYFWHIFFITAGIGLLILWSLYCYAWGAYDALNEIPYPTYPY